MFFVSFDLVFRIQIYYSDEPGVCKQHPATKDLQPSSQTTIHAQLRHFVALKLMEILALSTIWLQALVRDTFRDHCNCRELNTQRALALYMEMENLREERCGDNKWGGKPRLFVIHDTDIGIVRKLRFRKVILHCRTEHNVRQYTSYFMH